MHLLTSLSAFSDRRMQRDRWGPPQDKSRICGYAAYFSVPRVARKIIVFLRSIGVSGLCVILLSLTLVPGTSLTDPADAGMANRYLRAAEGGDATAQFYVAALYSAGVGVPQSDHDAFQWFLQAAKSRHNQAQLIVAALYAIGRGTTRDNVSAYQWAQVAARTNDSSIRSSASQLMEALKTRMSPNELATAVGQSDISTSGPKVETAADHYNRGLARARAREYALAVEEFDKVIRQNPTDVEALNNRCWSRAVLGRLEEALQDCDAALRLRPNYTDALDSRGLVNLKLRNFDRAISDFNAALRLNPDLPSALYGRGKARLRQGAADRGNADIKAAKALDPDIEDTFSHYGVK